MTDDADSPVEPLVPADNTFIADDGQVWAIVGPSTACSNYTDVRRLSDGKMSVRSTGLLRAAGMLVPEAEEEEEAGPGTRPEPTEPPPSEPLSTRMLTALPVPERGLVVHCKRDPYDVLIDRSTPWGNPYSHLPHSAAQYTVATREEAIDYYREWLRQRVRAQEPGLVEALAGLHGKVLGCHCAPESCHGDVLLDAAEWAFTSVTKSVT